MGHQNLVLFQDTRQLHHLCCVNPQSTVALAAQSFEYYQNQDSRSKKSTAPSLAYTNPLLSPSDDTLKLDPLTLRNIF